MSHRLDRFHYPRRGKENPITPWPSKQLLEIEAIAGTEEFPDAFDNLTLDDSIRWAWDSSCVRWHVTKQGRRRYACSKLWCPYCAKQFALTHMAKLWGLYRDAGPVVIRYVDEAEAADRIAEINNPEWLTWWRVSGNRRALIFPHPSGKEGKALWSALLDVVLATPVENPPDPKEWDDDESIPETFTMPDLPSTAERIRKVLALHGYDEKRLNANAYRFTTTVDGRQVEAPLDEQTWTILYQTINRDRLPNLVGVA